MIIRNLSVALTGTILAVSAVPSFAQNAMSGPSSRVVAYNDLDLSNEMGRKRLETRVRSAANATCGYRQAQTLTEKLTAERCLNDTIAASEPKVDAAARKAMRRK